MKNSSLKLLREKDNWALPVWNNFILISLFIFFLIPINAFSQKEASVWLMDLDEGFDFNYEPPRKIVTPNFHAQLHKTVISDADGKMLFYTDGHKIFNSNHEIMDNGEVLNYPVWYTNGLYSIICKIPGTLKKYYVFMISKNEWYPELNLLGEHNTLHYSIVDMDYNSGLGKVIEKRKILNNNTNRYTVIAGVRNQFNWLVVHADQLLVYKLSINGIEQMHAFELDQANRYWGSSILKSTPDGKKLLFPTNIDGYFGIQLFDFDPYTGSIKKGEFIKMSMVGDPPRIWYAMDFECSSDARYLYVIDDDDGLMGVEPNNILHYNVYRYDLHHSSAKDIEESIELIINDEDYLWAPGSIQLNWRGDIVLLESNGMISLIKKSSHEKPEFVFQPYEKINAAYLTYYPSFYFYDCFNVDYGPYAGNNMEICAGTVHQIGTALEEGFSYRWEPTEYISQVDKSLTSLKIPFNAIEEPDTLHYMLELTDTIGCVFQDSVEVIAKPAFSTEIIGPVSVCPGSDSIAYWIGDTSHAQSITWQSSGGSIASTDYSDTVLINWGVTNKNASVAVNILNSFQCYDQPDSLRISVFKEIDTEKPTGYDTIPCTESILSYAVLPKNGSYFDWKIVNGEITDGQGSECIIVDWDTNSKKGKLWIDEHINTNLEVCFGRSDTLIVENPRGYQSENIFLDRISSTLKDTSLLVSDYRILYPEFYLEQFELKRLSSSSWESVTSLDKTSVSIETIDPSKNLGMNEYIVAGYNLCQEPVYSVPHNNIYLFLDYDPEKGMTYLNWNYNMAWNEFDTNYDIYKRLDDESAYHYIASTEQTFMELNDLKDGFKHSYYVAAKNNTLSLSALSNIAGFEYQHPIMIPNVFTPNNDGFNDTFQISNIELYAENELGVFNREGKEVLRMSNYNNNWNGEGQKAGVYFYEFKTRKYNQYFKGWVQLLK